MSRWVEQFEAHPFQSTWNNILELRKELNVDDQTVATAVQELARLNKVIVYLDKLINTCDPELIPNSTWQNFQNQSIPVFQQMTNYKNTRNIGHINNANDHLDNLLTYLRPYQVSNSDSAKALNDSFKEYSVTVNGSLESFKSNADNILNELEVKHSAANTVLMKVEEINDSVSELESRYFDDSKKPSLETRVGEFESEIGLIYEELLEYRNLMFQSNEETYSIKERFDNALLKSEKNSDEIEVYLHNSTENLSKINEYYFTVFGQENSEGELIGGLKEEVEKRKKQLDSFKDKQELKYNELNKEIEGLLPGATSAGLATAYSDMKGSFDKPVSLYSKIFYSSISFLVFIAFVSITQEISSTSIKFVEVTNLEHLFSNILYKLPIILPVVWLTMFASKRRSESLRLQQEYAHKEALAKSYQSFKMQIDSLDQENPELMVKLLDSAIDAVSKNASDTLDKKHGDKMPVNEGVDSIVNTIEKLKKTLS